MKQSTAAGILFLLLVLMGGSLALAFLMDAQIAFFMATLRTPFLDQCFRIITSSYFLLATLYAIPCILLLKKKRHALIPYLFLSLAVTEGLIFLMKATLERPRPLVEHLVSASGYSFPSGHAASAFAALPLLFFTFPRRRGIFVGIAGLISISRIYGGVHYLTDVLIGAIIGVLIGEFILSFHFDDRYLEFRRQFFHALFGAFLFLLYYLYYIGEIVLASILLAGIVVALIQRKKKILFITWFLAKLDRKEALPGRGAITLVLGVLLSILLFPREIALVAIIAVVFLDMVSTLAGKTLGSIRNPLNREKTVEGSLLGFIVAFLWCAVFLPWNIAFLAALAAATIEAIEGGILRLDDNITIPLVTGAVLLLIQL